MQQNKAEFHDQQLKGERVHSLLVSFRIHTDASKRFKPIRCAVKSFCVKAAVQITLIVLVAGLVTVAGGFAVG